MAEIEQITRDWSSAAVLLLALWVLCVEMRRWMRGEGR